MNLPNLQQYVPLAPYTTYRIGGPADYYVEVHTRNELAAAITEARRIGLPYFLLGTGANILVSDRGFQGLVIRNRAQAFTVDDSRLTAESGAVMAELIAEAANRNLSGFEHFSGIPSSVGGAIWQNLHFLSPDRTRTIFIAEFVESAQILDQDNQIRTVERDFFQFGYDDSILHHQEVIVLAVTFQLSRQPRADILRQAAANLAWRRARQPQLDAFPSCGSVFKKIDGVGAGRLIDQAGLKGKTIGGAQISPKHANFIVNLGHATAADVLALAHLAQQTVKQQTGHELEMEIRLVGAFS